MEIGAYLQCYKNPYATYKCLESFRKFYPNSTVVLLSDNGYHYMEMAKHFKCIYIHKYDKATFIHKNFENDSHILNNAVLINRMIEVFQLIKEDYVVWLEDDVSINGRISCSFNHDLNGFCPNPIQKFILENLKKTYTELDVETKYHFTGHGGSVYKKTAALECFKNTEIWKDVVENWQFYNTNKIETPSDICQDFLFSILFVLNGKTIGPYEGHYDFRHFINQDITVQHQYKHFYNVELPDELKYLVKII